MYSDTHFHFNILREEDCWTRRSVLQKMALNGCSFALDIGVKAEDLPVRQKLFAETFSELEAGGDAETVSACKNFIHFSAGIWPDPDSIRARFECLKALRANIIAAKKSPDAFNRKLVALGECGLDHHWNPGGADGRSESDFDAKMFEAERELFLLQLEMAKEYSLPVIVHSRDAASETLDCIREAGYHNGIIHCYSYGLSEARAFLDLGWYISFSGSVTYTKKSRLDDMRALLAFVPCDRILLETDAPYLSPVPMRGRANNPTFIEHTYKYVSEARGISSADLCRLVDGNAARLFCLAD